MFNNFKKRKSIILSEPVEKDKNMDEKIKQIHFSRRTKIVYKIEHDKIKIMKSMVFDGYFERSKSFALMGSNLSVLR